jgi:hypothetical protein
MFTFTLQTYSGEDLLTSHVFTNKDSALRAINTARGLAQREDNYEPLRINNGLIYFVLKNTRLDEYGIWINWPKRTPLAWLYFITKFMVLMGT